VSVDPRLNRLLDADGRCVNIAVDHGLFNERPFLDGIEDAAAVVRALVAAAPDAVQLTIGTAPMLQALRGRRPALVLRTDIANVYGAAPSGRLFSRLASGAVEQAVRLDAACVVVNLLWIPGQPELHEQCVSNVTRLRSACDRYGMPLMVEPLVMRSDATGGGYGVDGDLDRIMALVRQAVELGADVIKADPCDEATEYHHVIAIAAGRPVLVRGGGRVSDRAILTRTAEVMRQGAAGVVYGRNVIQHANPAAMTRALMAIVHDGAAPDRALALLAPGDRGR
jgi:DhnA family fructose-bisphosphate aldolase class Ia